MGAEASREGELDRVLSVEFEGLVGVVTLMIEVYFEAEGYGAVGGDDDGFFVVSGHKIRVRRRFRGDKRVLPRAADAYGFTEFPEIIDTAKPEGFVAVVAAVDVWVVSFMGAHTAHHQ